MVKVKQCTKKKDPNPLPFVEYKEKILKRQADAQKIQAEDPKKIIIKEVVKKKIIQKKSKKKSTKKLSKRGRPKKKKETKK
jgi:hypothetical protein